MIYLNELVVCITRKCNLTCGHCLRGDSQDIDMPEESINSILDGISSIGNITFSGGEPFLNIEYVKTFINTLREKNISVGTFAIVSNGTIVSMDIISLIYSLYDYCDCKEMFYLGISRDDYHDIPYNPIWDMFKHVYFKKLNKVLNSGKAKEYGIGEIDNDIPESFSIVKENNSIREENSIYIGCTGEVMTSCDIEYLSEKKYSLGNIFNKPLKSIIEDYV